jgi:hypothetical protein
MSNLGFEDVFERPVEDLDVMQWSAKGFNLKSISKQTYIFKRHCNPNFFLDFKLTLCEIAKYCFRSKLFNLLISN